MDPQPFIKKSIDFYWFSFGGHWKTYPILKESYGILLIFMDCRGWGPFWTQNAPFSRFEPTWTRVGNQTFCHWAQLNASLDTNEGSFNSDRTLSCKKWRYFGGRGREGAKNNTHPGQKGGLEKPYKIIEIHQWGVDGCHLGLPVFLWKYK